eukprot:249040-Pleurochrysis_carterae.AAC.1
MEMFARVARKGDGRWVQGDRKGLEDEAARVNRRVWRAGQRECRTELRRASNGCGISALVHREWRLGMRV